MMISFRNVQMVIEYTADWGIILNNSKAKCWVNLRQVAAGANAEWCEQGVSMTNVTES